MPGQRGPVPVLDGGRDITREILQAVDEHDTVTTSETFSHVPQPELKAAIDRLASRSMVIYETHDSEVPVLSAEGEAIAEEGSHEYKVWDTVRTKGKVSIKELPKLVGTDSAKVGQGNAFKLKWISKDSSGNLVPAAKDVEDHTRELLLKIQNMQLDDATRKAIPDLRKRKLCSLTKVISYTVKKGPKFATEIAVQVTDLTADMIADGSWQTANFKSYNFRALGASQNPGALHPLNKVRAEFRQIFFNQGFVEMPTNRYVDTGFWNFDTLYVPQQHPARDLQDTFFVSDPPLGDFPRDDPVADAAMVKMEGEARKLYATPERSETKPRDYEEYWNNVRESHQAGKYGSIGYRYPWDPMEARRLVLRTHTTAISAWCLHRLAEDPRPARYFSVDRVFRNETVDATHLAEFHQVEGVIADFGLTLGGLMKFMENFFGQLGITNLRFKPAYNPYTEPSMEIFGYHTGLKKWVEIGNSGMFRPEMLQPMGLPPDLRCYGFGLSLERPTYVHSSYCPPSNTRNGTNIE